MVDEGSRQQKRCSLRATIVSDRANIHYVKLVNEHRHLELFSRFGARYFS